MAVRLLRDLAVGSKITLKEDNTSNATFYVAKHDYEPELNGPGRTLLVRTAYCESGPWRDRSESDTAYATSDVDAWCNQTYKSKLSSDIQEAIGTTTFYCVVGNGDTTVSTLSRSIFLLSAAELGLDVGVGSGEPDVGTVLPIASTLVKIFWKGYGSHGWTRSMKGSNPTWVGVTNDKLCASGSDKGNTGTYIPALTLPAASVCVNDDGTVILDSPPVITGSVDSGHNFGVKNDSFNVTYSVSDVDGDSITVTEYLDATPLRSFIATPSEVYSFVFADFQKILNGEHTLKVIANDGKVDSEAFTVTFTKKVTFASVTMETPVTTDSQITVMAAGIIGSLPDDVVVEVLVTNNAKDSTPVWENATESILNGVNHVFTNKSAANGFAFNFRLTVSRGASDVGGYVNSFGGELGSV